MRRCVYLLAVLVLASAAWSDEDLLTWTERDDASQITISGTGNNAWSCPDSTDADNCIYKAYSMDKGWTWAFRVGQAYADATNDSWIVWAVTNSGQSKPGIVSAGGDMVYVRCYLTSTNMRLQIRVMCNGEIVDTATSDALTTWKSYSCVVTRSGDTYSVTATQTDDSSNKWTGDATVIDPEDNTFSYVLAMSYDDNSSGTDWMAGSRYVFTDTSDPTSPAATLYVGPSATGTGSGADRSNLMAIATWFDHAGKGETAMLQPGDYKSLYSTLDFDAELGPWGDVNEPIRLVADPVTCAARDTTWYSDVTATEPNTSERPIFGTIDVGTAAAKNQYLEIDGIVVHGFIDASPYCNHVTLSNIGAWGTTTMQSDTRTDPVLSAGIPSYGLKLYNTNASHVTVEDCRFEGYLDGVWMLGTFGQGMLIDHCAFTRIVGSHAVLYSDASANSTEADYKVLDGVRLHGVVNHAVDSAAYLDTTVSSVGSPGNRVFATTAALGATYDAWIRVTHGGETVYRKASSVVGTTVTLMDDLPWNVTVGDAVRGNDSIHGTGLIIAFTGNNTNYWTFKNGYILDVGQGTNAIYDYGGTASYIRFWSNVVTGWQNTLPQITSGGNYWDIRHNLFVGYSGLGSIQFTKASGTTASTITVANNIFVGGATFPTGITAYGNFATTATGFSDGVNDNVVNASLDFDAQFVGPLTGWRDTAWGSDFYAALHLKAGSVFVNSGNATYGLPTDAEGGTWGGTVEKGPFGYYPAGSRKRIIIAQ